MSTLNVTTIQANLHWEDKEANLRMFADRISKIGNARELVVLPEMFSTGFSMNPYELAETMEGPTVRWMKEISASKRIILTGSLIIKEEDVFYNRLVWVLPNGQLGHYDKRHLFGYGGEHNHYAPGKKRLIASAKGWKVNLQICYDLRFPVWARQSDNPAPQNPTDSPSTIKTPEYDLLVYVANWPEKRNHAWKTLLMARAIENQCYVVGVNRVGMDGNEIYHSGDTMIVDPMGAVMYSKAHEEDIFSTALDKHSLNEIRTRLPFLNDGDQFHIHT